jgi:hypothetical protein
MNAVIATQGGAELMERVVVAGDLSKLSAADRVMYYAKVCESVGLNPLTRPFEYLTLSGKQVLYAKRDATDQLRKIHGVSVVIKDRQNLEGVYIVTANAKDKTGREDESTGAVSINGLKGDALANALMKAETKAKRRVTLSICGLGMLDETELETIPGAIAHAGDAPPLPPPAEDPTLVPCGKHKGKKWLEVSDDYLGWATSSPKAPEALRIGAEVEQERRAKVFAEENQFGDDSDIPFEPAS